MTTFIFGIDLTIAWGGVSSFDSEDVVLVETCCKGLPALRIPAIEYGLAV